MKLRDTLGHRWALNTTQDIGRDGDVMIRRHRLVQTPLFGVYVHEIHRPDADQALHDHPWSFVTLILRGGYIEEYARPRNGSRIMRRMWSRWTAHRIDATRDAHRIDEVMPGTVTLVVVGRKHRTWGFWQRVDWRPEFGEYVAGWVPWREYLGLDTEPMVP